MIKRSTPTSEVSVNPVLVPPPSLRKVTARNLQRAARLRKEIDSLRQQLAQLLDGPR